MCGIAGGFCTQEQLEKAMTAIEHRGPDGYGFDTLREVKFGHVRLSIIDPEPRSDQPYYFGSICIIFNGEIWNYKELREELTKDAYVFSTHGDAEVLAALIHQVWANTCKSSLRDETDSGGMTYKDDYCKEVSTALNRVEGMFALAWQNGDFQKEFFMARDRHGEVPLHHGRMENGGVVFASEVKGLLAMGCLPHSIKWVTPGTFHYCQRKTRSREIQWYFPHITGGDGKLMKNAVKDVRRTLRLGVSERTISDVPVCTLLSGGIDSAAVASVLQETYPGIVAYTAVMDTSSPDLKAARRVAQYLDIDLVEIPIETPTPDGLATVVEVIEMPHKAQVEIGWACLQLAQAMKSDGFKVTYSGEGSDELWGSYGFSYWGIKKEGWYEHRKNLFFNQHRKNFARCNKIFMAWGVECRLPFLNTQLVECALGLPMDAVRQGNRPKAVLERAFKSVLPEDVMRRSKLAFQDGLGLKERIREEVYDPRAFYKAEYGTNFRGVKS